MKSSSCQVEKPAVFSMHAMMQCTGANANMNAVSKSNAPNPIHSMHAKKQFGFNIYSAPRASWSAIKHLSQFGQAQMSKRPYISPYMHARYAARALKFLLHMELGLHLE